ncbi:TraX family protein [Clostridium sp. HBUAS56017]|uniref:TraX family protein n=1 Tax=Clostridium sp. HBUAS56017 TaxID=2571128 RepID=UPI0011788A6E|nr:TraX family protein [Clostridium sp. HBUAS56017]
MKSYKGLTNNELKILAIIAMTMDHIAYGFITPSTITYEVFRAIGKLTIVIMCYMVVEGYKHTHNIKKYLLRMFIFALISHIPYVFLFTGKVSLLFGERNFHTSVIWSLLLGLILICVWNDDRFKKIYKIILLIIICCLSTLGDWGIFAVILIFGFNIYYGNRKKQMIFLGICAMFIDILTIYQLSLRGAGAWYSEIYLFGLLLGIPVLLKYNGTLGKSKNLKWLFYIYYPLHQVILGILAHI